VQAAKDGVYAIESRGMFLGYVKVENGKALGLGG
jgi:hypothetical protein